jgi:NADH-quinone oxidoreductase subunit C
MADDAAPTDAPASEGVHKPVDEAAAAVVEKFPGSVAVDSHGQAVVYVDRASWRDIARFLRDEEQFSMCADVTAVDHLVDDIRYMPPGVESQERFEVVANFLSHARNRRLRLICQVSADEPSVPSLVELFPGLGIAEREVYDLLGITFDEHPDHTRILMPDDWVGHPLRKDDPPARVPVVFKGDPAPR